MTTEFKLKYPLLMNVLEAYLRPKVDSYNLFITIHMVMKDSPSAMAEGLINELQQLTLEGEINKENIINEFNADIPKENQLMNHDNVQQLLLSLYEYAIFLYENENFKGARKWEV